jgi:hypothetical protein
LALAGDLTLLFDERILEEYREVLHRPRFAIPRDQLAEVLEQLEADGELVAISGTSRRTSASSCCHREIYCSDSIPSSNRSPLTML